MNSDKRLTYSRHYVRYMPKHYIMPIQRQQRLLTW